MFHVTYWDNGKIYKSFEKLAIAKRYARDLGHTGQEIPFLTGFPPIAYVSNDNGECVYNPRFGFSSKSSTKKGSNNEHKTR